MTDDLVVRRVLVRPPNWLGDAVMALPALAAVRRHFAADHLTIAASPSVAPIFREDTDVAADRVLDLPAGTRAAVAVLEGEGCDVGILFPNSFRSAWQFWRAGIAQRWGMGSAGRALLLTRKAVRPRPSGPLHQAEYYRALVTSLGIECQPASPPRIRARAPSLERAGALIVQHGVDERRRLVGIAPGAAYGQAKQWPPERMAETASRLIRHEGATCLVVGASHDRPAARAIESWLRAHAPDTLPHIVDLTGRTSLGALAGLMSRLSAFLSNDSGAMHLAAALGCPVVAVFGPTDERVTHPLGEHAVITEPVFCRPCLLRECPIDHRCMKRISIDRVYAAVQAYLSGPMR
jgi:heptosyltransferase-2